MHTPNAPLRHHIRSDLVIIGGGITGLLTAIFLGRTGRQITLLERAEIGQGETARSTGHVTEVLDARFSRLAQTLGADSVRRLTEAHRMAIHRLVTLLEEIDGKGACGWTRVPGYLFAEHDHQVAELRAEVEALASLHIPSTLQKHSPLPFPVIEAIRVENQGVVEPTQVLKTLKRAALAEGIRIFETSPALEIEVIGGIRNTGVRVLTAGGSVSAETCIIATHSPIWGPLMGVSSSHLMLSPRRSYVLAAKLKTPTLIEGIHWDMAHPYHYIRTVGDELWVGGMDHKTGHAGHPGHSGGDILHLLEDYTRSRFEVESITRSWSGQILETHDGLPLVGASLRSSRVLFATGFGGNGLSMASLAATELCSLALGNPSELGSLLSPHRIPSMKGWWFLARENMDYLKNRVGSQVFPSKLPDPEVLAPGEACVGTYLGNAVAMSRDAEGELRAVSARCTHLGAELTYNEFEKSWDCPCHGSRFSLDGKVLCGPATNDLEPVAVTSKKREKKPGQEAA